MPITETSHRENCKAYCRKWWRSHNCTPCEPIAKLRAHFSDSYLSAEMRVRRNSKSVVPASGCSITRIRKVEWPSEERVAENWETQEAKGISEWPSFGGLWRRTLNRDVRLFRFQSDVHYFETFVLVLCKTRSERAKNAQSHSTFGFQNKIFVFVELCHFRIFERANVNAEETECFVLPRTRIFCKLPTRHSAPNLFWKTQRCLFREVFIVLGYSL